jgi:iron-sulfur cluster assembly protein
METSTSATRIVDVTPEALARMEALLSENPEHTAIRVGVLGGGCAGLQYDMHPTAERKEGDFVQPLTDAVNLFIHPVAVAYLKGTTIDYSNAMVDGGFKFKNPNASNTCGCGTSFGV